MAVNDIALFLQERGTGVMEKEVLEAYHGLKVYSNAPLRRCGFQND